MINRDPLQVKEAFSKLSDAQLNEMTDEYWNNLLYRIEDEIQRIEAGKGPDHEEYALLKKIDHDPRDLSL